MTVEANGAQLSATAAGLGTAVPYGDGEGRGQAPPLPPPPPFNALGNDLADLRHEVGLISQAVLQLQDRPEKPRRQVPPSVRQFPKRHVVPIVIAVGTLATVVGITQCSPRLSEEQVADRASMIATDNAVSEQDQRWAEMRAEATTVVEPDPLSVYGLELDENAKTAIGWVGTPGNLRLNPVRAEYVAKQVRVLAASVRLLDLRMTSLSPTELRVHTNVGEGYPLFRPPATQAPAAPTTVTSAP